MADAAVAVALCTNGKPLIGRNKFQRSVETAQTGSENGCLTVLSSNSCFGDCTIYILLICYSQR